MVAREQARKNREVIKLPQYAWTDDPVIRRFRFCNINREHDAVTRWIDVHVRRPLFHHPKADLVLNLFLARVFNHPPSLQALGLVEFGRGALEAACIRMAKYQASGAKLMRGAYMMGAHGPKNKGVNVVDYYFRIAGKLLDHYTTFNQAECLSTVAGILRQCEGIGSFVANQVVTDLRYTPQFELAPDWETFITAGPGTRRGLNHIHGRPVRQAVPEEQATTEVLELRDMLVRVDQIRWQGIADCLHDPNNVSNSLCEFDKYVRGLNILTGHETDGMSRMRVYQP